MVYIAKSEYMQDILSVLDAGRRAGVPAVLWGPPGTGKTKLINALAEREGLVVKILLGSIMDPTDLSGLPAIETRIAPDGTPYQITRNTVADWADDLIKLGRGVLFLDELNNAVPTMQSAFLSLLQGRQVGQYVLPKDIWIIAASNEEKDAADGYTLAPPMANRLIHIDWNPSAKDWFEGMSENWGEDTSLAIRESRLDIVSYLRDFPNLLQVQPTDDEKAGKAWPSRRSWDNAAVTLGEGNLNDNSRLMLVKGLVGETAALQYFKWKAEKNLPSNNQVLSNPEAIDWRKMKADIAYTILGRTPYLVDETNIVESLHVHIVAMRNGRQDMVSNISAQMINVIKTKGLMPVASAGNLKEYLSTLAEFTKTAGLGAASKK